MKLSNSNSFWSRTRDSEYPAQVRYSNTLTERVTHPATLTYYYIRIKWRTTGGGQGGQMPPPPGRKNSKKMCKNGRKKIEKRGVKGGKIGKIDFKKEKFSYTF